MRNAMIALLLATGVCGCGHSLPPAGPPGIFPPVQKPVVFDESLEALLSAPVRITIGSREYTLEAMLQRDFMPGNSDTSLRCYAYVRTSGQAAFPAMLDADLLWVIRGEEVWRTPLTDIDAGREPNVLGKKAWGGPKWEAPGRGLTAVVRLRHKGTGGQTLLRVSDLGILATH